MKKNTHGILSLILTIVMMVSIFPINTIALPRNEEAISYQGDFIIYNEQPQIRAAKDPYMNQGKIKISFYDKRIVFCR